MKKNLAALTGQVGDAYLAAAVEFAGSFQCRTAGAGRKCRLAFVADDRRRLDHLAAVIGEPGRIYQSAGEATWRLEYYTKSVIRAVVDRVRPLVGPHGLEKIDSFTSLADGGVP